MALIHCPDCGMPVSSEAPFCPNCGAPNLVKQLALIQAKEERKAKIFCDEIIQFCIGAFIGLILIAIFISLG
jgi:uncharacterized membrane protein YvbJ